MCRAWSRSRKAWMKSSAESEVLAKAKSPKPEEAGLR